jgi:hypothetical protein
MLLNLDSRNLLIYENFQDYGMDSRQKFILQPSWIVTLGKELYS